MPKALLVGETRMILDGVEKALGSLEFAADDWHVADAPDSSDGELLVELGGRICYRSFGKAQHTQTNERYIANIVEQRHGSVLTHASYTFYVECSRSCSHELIRHNWFGFSQVSQRYVDESDTTFVVPYAVEKAAPGAKILWGATMNDLRTIYGKLVDQLAETAPELLSKKEKRIWARQAARSVLPNATKTMFLMSGNARAWYNMLLLRGTRHAEIEIRTLALQFYDILQATAPHIFGTIHIVDDPAVGRVLEGHHV